MKKEIKKAIRVIGSLIAITIACLIFLAIIAAICRIGWGLGDYWVKLIIMGLLQ